MIVPLLCAVLIGVVLPLQAGVNAQLRVGLGHPMLAATASFLVGTLALAVAAAAARLPVPLGPQLVELPWWSWTGGLLGAVYVAAVIVLVPKLGAATLIAAVVAGQLLASLVLDHYGLVGYAHHPINLSRLLGALLLMAGVLLIQKN